MIIKRGLADEAPRTLARWYASLRAKGNIALAGATIALVLLALGLTFVAGAFAYRQGLVSGYEKSVMRRLMHPVSYVRSFTAPTLPRLTVDMKLKHLRKVEAKREEAIQRGILFSSDDDYVPAQLRFDGRGIPVKMRLKGDTWPHFAGDKWSFRINSTKMTGSSVCVDSRYRVPQREATLMAGPPSKTSVMRGSSPPV